MEIDFHSEIKNINNSSYEEMFAFISEKVQKHLSLKAHYFLEVNIVDDVEIHKINKEYRGIDRPTDVISFAFLDKVDGELPIKHAQVVFLGEIIISIDKAVKQAHDYSHSLEREMAFLFTHGLLHLLGYDHDSDDKEKIMFSLQDEILEDTKWKKNN